MVRAEFTVYPFREGEEPPAHVRSAIDAAAASGAQVEVGVLSTTVRGEPEQVLRAVLAAELAALAAGATRIVVDVEAEP